MNFSETWLDGLVPTTGLFPLQTAFGVSRNPYYKIFNFWLTSRRCVAQRDITFLYFHNFFFVTLDLNLNTVMASLPSPLCAQWHNANVSGMVVASLHEWISAFWKASKWTKSSSIVWGVGKGLRLWGISGGCMTWRLHPAEPVDTWIPEIVL